MRIWELEQLIVLFYFRYRLHFLLIKLFILFNAVHVVRHSSCLIEELAASLGGKKQFFPPKLTSQPIHEFTYMNSPSYGHQVTSLFYGSWILRFLLERCKRWIIIYYCYNLFSLKQTKKLIDNNNNNELISSYILGQFTGSFGICPWRPVNWPEKR